MKKHKVLVMDRITFKTNKLIYLRYLAIIIHITLSQT